MRRRAGATAPFLRSPPFPHVPAASAAISRSTGAAPSRLDLDPALVALLAEARVGGAFWGRPVDPTARRPIVLRPRSATEAAAMLVLAAQDGVATGDMVAILDGPAAAACAATLDRAGVAHLTGEIDPWSLLVAGVRLYAGAGDEWPLVARLAGAGVAGACDPDVRLAAALGDVAYRNCYAGTEATIEEAVAILAGWRGVLDRTRGVTVAAGMAWWKREAIARLIWNGGARKLRFTDDSAEAVQSARQDNGAIAVWPSRAPAGLERRAAEAGVPLLQVEDGFIRSVGLGSNLHPPQSIVLDRRGIYYDPSWPSDLEHLLEHAAFPPELIARGERLAAFIVARGISKYARGGVPAPALSRDGRRLVLVTGQVEDDLSVKRAGAGVAGNLDLLKRTRAAEPDARILFKPHPDVDAGHRVGRIADDDALGFVDEVVRVPIDGLLGQVDAVHVLTSLTGFEALLRGRAVTVHGQPFYAGWGLTTDLAAPLARRTRRLTLAELVAGTLILYPLYLDPVTRLPCPPELLLERFASGTLPKPSLVIRARALQGRIAKSLGMTTN